MPHSNYAVQQIFLEIKDGTGTFPATLYAGLMLVSPALDGTGGTEIAAAPTHTWYARQAVTWAAPSLAGRTIANGTLVSFHASSPTAVAGNVVSVGLFTALTSGNLWRVCPLTTPMAIGVGSRVEFPIGQIVLEQKTTG